VGDFKSYLLPNYPFYKKGETPLLNVPSGFSLWHNLWAVCNEAAAQQKEFHL
jgi:hypothetical protein